jgi:hypothetical protein
VFNIPNLKLQIPDNFQIRNTLALWNEPSMGSLSFFVIPVKTGIQDQRNETWIPAGVYPVLDTGQE